MSRIVATWMEMMNKQYLCFCQRDSLMGKLTICTSQKGVCKNWKCRKISDKIFKKKTEQIMYDHSSTLCGWPSQTEKMQRITPVKTPVTRVLDPDLSGGSWSICLVGVEAPNSDKQWYPIKEGLCLCLDEGHLQPA